MKDDYKKFVSACFSLNYIFQGLYTLLTPIVVLGLLAWFLTAKCSVGSWIWAVLLIIGTILGLISMIKYLIKISDAEMRREEETNKED